MSSFNNIANESYNCKNNDNGNGIDNVDIVSIDIVNDVSLL